MVLILFRKTVLLSFLLFVVAITSAQNNELRPYTLEDGLPQSQVYDMAQDRTGYLWLGTQGGGLARFDGESFTIFNETSGLISNYIHALLVSDDSLFVGTKNGLTVKVKDNFRNYATPQINTIFRHGDDTFLGTTRGVYKFQKGEKPKKILLYKTLDTNIVNDIIFDGKSFWIASNKGLWRLNSIANNPEVEIYETTNFTSLVIYNEKLFASTFIDGILIIDPKKLKEDQIIVKPLRINQLEMINDKLWVSTDNDGITIIDPETFQAEKKINERHGLSVSHIRMIFKDQQANIWIGTSGGGFYKYFQNEFTHYDRDTGLKGNRVYAVHHDGNELWISNSEDGLATIDSLGIHLVPAVAGYENVKIKTITSDDDGNIWIGSDGKGILFRETTTRDSIVVSGTDVMNMKVDTLAISETKNHLINESIGLPSNWIRTLYIESDTIWAATYSSGIIKFRYNSIKGRITILQTFDHEDGIEDLLIRDMKVDTQGRVWYATETGSLGFIENDQVTYFGEVLEQKVPINTLLFKNETLFIGTAGSGIWYALENDYSTFKKLNGAKTLTSNNSYQLIFDYEENLWMGTERGVDKIILNKDLEIVDVFHFGRNDGFLGIETCLNAVDKDDKGNLWFGAIYGLTKYDAARTPDEKDLKPNIYFDQIEVGYQSIDSLPFVVGENSNKILQLNPNQTQISLSYRTIDLNHPKEIEYRFKLDDTEWSRWSSSNEQNLAGLAFGSHEFIVQSRNYRWEESDPIQFSFFIESPLYKKAWFQWLIIGLVLTLIALIAWNYMKRVKRKNRVKNEQLELENHLLTLEQKALRLQMNPHFIFNVLNGIKAMAPNNPQKMNATINTFATMLREILYNSRKESISLAQEIRTLKNYIEVEQLMAPKPFGFDIQVATEIDQEEILIPPMLIQPFVENAIRHGITNNTRDGKLKVYFRTTEDFLYCSIVDNGMGIFESQKNKKTTDHQSMALTVTKERIESLSGKNALVIKEIIRNEKVEGTEISFKIPLETDY